MGENTKSNQGISERRKEKNIDSFVLIREHANIRMCAGGVTVVPLKLKRVAVRESEAEGMSHETD